MPPSLCYPLLYLITDGTLSHDAALSDAAARALLDRIAAAVHARLSFVQIREKNLAPRTLYELARRVAKLTQNSATRLLINDRADIARAVGADGVHLTTQSLPADVVRRAFGPDFIISVSTHHAHEAHAARRGGADFITFGPVFDTPSKRAYGAPVGLDALATIVREVAPLPVLALGGITPARVPDVARTGAAGVAAISLWQEVADVQHLGNLSHSIATSFS